MNKLLERLIKNCNEEDLIEIILKFINIPITCDEKNRDLLIEPFIFIDNYYSDKKLKTDIKIEPRIIESLVNSSKRSGLERKNAITRFVVLWEYGFIDEKEETKLAEAIWCKLDKETGFPLDTHYANMAVFLELPYPSNYKVEENFKQFIFYTLEIVEHDYRIVIDELIYSLSERKDGAYLCNWTKEERIKLVWFALNYYKSIRAKLGTEDSANAIYINTLEDCHQNINELIDLLMDIILHQGILINLPEEYKKELRSLIDELVAEKIPCNKLKVSCRNVIGCRKDDYFEQLLPISYSNNVPQIVDCFDAIYYYLLLDKVDKEEGSRLLSLVIGQIVARRKESLYVALDIMIKSVEFIPEYMNDEIRNNLICGLDFLYEESQMNKNDANYFAGIRAQAMRLAGRLYHYFRKEEREMPYTLELWKALTENSNEFWEVRNAWIVD